MRPVLAAALSLLLAGTAAAQQQPRRARGGHRGTSGADDPDSYTHTKLLACPKGFHSAAAGGPHLKPVKRDEAPAARRARGASGAEPSEDARKKAASAPLVFGAGDDSAGRGAPGGQAQAPRGPQHCVPDQTPVRRADDRAEAEPPKDDPGAAVPQLPLPPP